MNPSIQSLHRTVTFGSFSNHRRAANDDKRPHWQNSLLTWKDKTRREDETNQEPIQILLFQWYNEEDKVAQAHQDDENHEEHK